MKIAYLYYDFLNLYGEDGNIKMIESVLKYNDINYEIDYISLQTKIDFEKYNLIYISSGTESNQKIALKYLLKYKKEIKKYIESNNFLLATGNSFHMFASKIITKDKKYEGLGIFDFEVIENKRIIEDVFIGKSEKKVIGFINHAGHIDSELIKKESISYKNFYATNILGPLLVRNPSILKKFMNKLTNKKLMYDLELEEKAYKLFVENKIKQKEQ